MVEHQLPKLRVVGSSPIARSSRARSEAPAGAFGVSGRRRVISRISAATAAPLPAPPWGRLTRKGSKLYAIIFDWPKEGRALRLALASPVRTARLLADGAAVKCEPVQGGGVDLRLPAARSTR